MSKLSVVMAEERDVQFVARNLRLQDVRDASAFGLPADRLTVDSARNAEYLIVAREGDTPIALAGISRSGTVWVLMTPAAGRYIKTLTRIARAWTDMAVVKVYDRIENYVPAFWDPQRLRWLELIGFTVDREAFITLPNGTYYRAFKERPHELRR